MALLEVLDLHVSFNEKEVLKGVSLSLEPGQKLLIEGHNGAGKTTLIETIMGFIKPLSGRVLFKGKEPKTEDDWLKLRTGIGYVFQNPDDQLFCPTVYEDISFGPLNLGFKNVDEIVNEVLKLFDVLNLKDRFTHTLSGGEKRIISIAAVLAMKPEALIMDEPSAGLDEEKLQKLAQFLNETKKAVIVVSHDSALRDMLNWQRLILKDGVLRTL